VTFREYFVAKLQDNGFWPDDAVKLMDDIIKKNESPAMEGRWDENAEGYPHVMKTVLWAGDVRPAGLEFIKAHHPQAWYRPMFENPVTGDK